MKEPISTQLFNGIRGGILIGVIGAICIGAALPDIEHAGTAADPWVVPDIKTLCIQLDPYPDHEVKKIIIYICVNSNFMVAEDNQTDFTSITFEGEILKTKPTRIPIYDQIKSRPDGVYYLKALVVDSHARISPWSPTYVLSKQWSQSPPAPGCRMVFYSFSKIE
jgi:hypothetical protein